MERERERGTIKALLAEKRYGFIGRPGQRDLFFHSRDCSAAFDHLEVGGAVEFAVREDRQGRLSAHGVTVVASPAAAGRG